MEHRWALIQSEEAIVEEKGMETETETGKGTECVVAKKAVVVMVVGAGRGPLVMATIR